uniref:DUF3421 domain-containing protein n=1 Tax=Caenorhabditis tropicalis TaxID=1561998 RepID=A0A1I7URB9_9PELO
MHWNDIIIFSFFFIFDISLFCPFPEIWTKDLYAVCVSSAFFITLLLFYIQLSIEKVQKQGKISQLEKYQTQVLIGLVNSTRTIPSIALVIHFSAVIYITFIDEALAQCQIIYKNNRSFIKMASLMLSFHILSLYYSTLLQYDSLIKYQVVLCLISITWFWYEWIKYKDRIEKLDDKHQLVRCGDSFPIFWKRKEGNLLGYVDNKTEEAWFSSNGKVIKQLGPQLNDMYIITRNCIGGPPHCECENCPKPPPPPPVPPPGPPPPRVMHDEWIDIREGDPFPTRKLVQALDKSLDTLPGVNPDQYVALWYMQGEPVMGRVWNEGGKVAANFSWFNNEYCKNVGSIQLLVRLGPHVVGYEYGWIPFAEAATFEEGKTWKPVHVNNHKGDISVGVVNLPGGKQILAKVDVRNESYGYGYQGKEVSARGPACASSVTVLCRKALPGYKLDG